MSRGSLKIVGMVVVMVMVALCLTVGPGFAASKELTVWYLKRFVPSGNDNFLNLAEEFGKQEGVKVNVELIAFDEMKVKGATAIETGDVPDLIHIGQGYTILWADMGVLEDVTDIALEVSKPYGGFSATAIAGSVKDGRYWGVPYSGICPPWFYRKDLIKEAGFDLKPIENGTWTLDYFVQMAKKITNPAKGIYGAGMTLSPSQDAVDFSNCILWAFGGKLVEKDGKTVAINSKETLAAMKWLADLYVTHKIMPPGAFTWTDIGNNEAWLRGQIAFTGNGGSLYWALGNQKNPLFEKTGAATPPLGPSGISAGLGNVETFDIFKKSKNKDLAKDFLRFLFKKENYISMLESQGGQLVSVLKESFAGLPMYKDPNIAVIRKVFEGSRLLGWEGPLTAASMEVTARHIFLDGISRIVVEKWTPEKALAEVSERVNEVYKAYYK